MVSFMVFGSLLIVAFVISHLEGILLAMVFWTLVTLFFRAMNGNDNDNHSHMEITVDDVNDTIDDKYKELYVSIYNGHFRTK